MPARHTPVSTVLADLTRFAERAVVQVVTEVAAELAVSTPVDTGFARASWIPSVGTPSSEQGGSEEAPNPAAATQGLREVLAYRLTMGKAYVANNVRYIRKLDRGHSKQAPAGFVRTSVERGTREAMRVLSTSKRSA